MGLQTPRVRVHVCVRVCALNQTQPCDSSENRFFFLLSASAALLTLSVDPAEWVKISGRQRERERDCKAPVTSQSLSACSCREKEREWKSNSFIPYSRL